MQNVSLWRNLYLPYLLLSALCSIANLHCRRAQVDSFYGSDAQRLDDHLWLHDDA